MEDYEGDHFCSKEVSEDEPILDDEAVCALEYELSAMGLTVDDLLPPEDGKYDARALARMESAQLLSRKFIERDAIKSSMSVQKEKEAGECPGSHVSAWAARRVTQVLLQRNNVARILILQSGTSSSAAAPLADLGFLSEY
jgi:hypothetical protein